MRGDDAKEKACTRGWAEEHAGFEARGSAEGVCRKWRNDLPNSNMVQQWYMWQRSVCDTTLCVISNGMTMGSRWRRGSCCSLSLCSGAHVFRHGGEGQQQRGRCGMCSSASFCSNVHLVGDCQGRKAPNATRRGGRSGCGTRGKLCENVHQLGVIGADWKRRQECRCFGCPFAYKLCGSADLRAGERGDARMRGDGSEILGADQLAQGTKHSRAQTS